jgi:hypothetical protein
MILKAYTNPYELIAMVYPHTKRGEWKLAVIHNPRVGEQPLLYDNFDEPCPSREEAVTRILETLGTVVEACESARERNVLDVPIGKPVLTAKLVAAIGASFRSGTNTVSTHRYEGVTLAS